MSKDTETREEASVEALSNEYGHWGEHPTWPLDDWRSEVANDDTRLGYWQWVVEQIDSHEG